MRKLETERLILREWKLADAEDMYSWAKSETVGPMAGWKPHESLAKSQSVIEMFLESDEVYAIVYKETGKVIGSIGIHDRSPDESLTDIKQRELGFVLSEDYWGMGIMPEAVKRCIDFAFDEIGAEMLWCGHYEDNMQSKRVIEKCGFKHQFIKEGVAKLLDNKKTITWYYNLIKDQQG